MLSSHILRRRGRTPDSPAPSSSGTYSKLSRLLSRQPSQFVSTRSYGLLIFASSLFLLVVLVWLNQTKIVDLSRYFSPSVTKTAVPKARGGWRLPDDRTVRAFGSERCTIERRWAGEINVEEFEREYRFRRPLLLRFDKGAESWTNAALWTRRRLMRDFGDLDVASGRSEAIVKAGGRGNIQSSLEEFLTSIMEERDSSDEPMYVFDRSFVADSHLLTGLSLPPFLQPTRMDDSFLFLGASKSGVSFHKHADAWNGVIWGAKRWFLYPPNSAPPGGIWPGFSQLDWVQKVYPNLTQTELPQECIQYPGEILYLPESFYHGTVNIGDTVALGVQKRDASTEAERLFYQTTHLIPQVHHGRNTEVQESLRKKLIEIEYRLSNLLPESNEVKRMLAETLFITGQQDKGMELMREAMAVDPYFVHAQLAMARFHAQREEFQAAEDYFDKALQTNERNSDVAWQYSKHLMKHRSGSVEHIEKVVKLIKKVIDVNDQESRFFKALADNLDQLGRADEAKAARKKAQDLLED